jgi:hypothetical protein
MDKRPSLWTIILTGWLGFMFATAVAALIPSLQLLTAPILCHAPYGHGVVQVHNYSYGATSGYATTLRCANGFHQEHGANLFAVIGLLWLYGWVGALAIRGVYYWGKFLVKTGVDAYWRRRLPPVRPRQAISTPKMLVGAAPAAPSRAPAGAPAAPALKTMGGAVLVNGRWVARGADPVDQLARLADLYDRGALTEQEFADEKARILGG